MRRVFPLLCWWSTILCFLCAGAQAQQAFQAIAPNSENWPTHGQIEFTALQGENGLAIGQAMHEWRHGDGEYHMTTKLETTGLAAVLLNFQYIQSSHGKLLADGLQPSAFQIKQTHKPLNSAQFDWTNHKVSIQRRNKQVQSELQAGDQDILSVWHLLATHGANTASRDLNLVSNRRLTPVQLVVGETSTLSLPLGKLETRLATLSAHNGKMTIRLWLSLQHGLVPVRILIRNDKGEDLDLQATSLKLE